MLENENSIVDWIIIELRNSIDPTMVMHSRSALLQRDGDIVEVDGVSEIDFDGVVDDDYYVSIKHRNHLGVMTDYLVDLSTSFTIDFTNLLTEIYGEDPREMVEMDVYGLWAGDANFNGEIKYNGSSNDKNVILLECGLFTPSDNVINIYHTADIDMDGDIEYNGGGNDKNAILTRVGIFSPNEIIEQQIPQL